jgi:peptide/nickel transport system permease protein
MTSVSDSSTLENRNQRNDSRRLLRQMFSNPATAFGTGLVIIFLLLAIFGSLLAPYRANEQISGDARQPPSLKHWFGTDNLGRDVFSRVILGASGVILLAGAGTLVSVVLGTSIGLITAYQGKWIDEISMRFFDSLVAIPAILLALMFLGTIGPTSFGVLIVLVIVYTPIIARVVRSSVLSVKTLGYVEIARLQGETQSYILFREILPTVVPVLAVEAALRFSYAIFLVASLGFLGLGVQPPNPDWGLMVKEARVNVDQTPWAMYFPAGAIALIVVGVNLTADGLKKALQQS